MPWRKDLLPRLSAPLAAQAAALDRAQASRLTEIRVRGGQPVRFVFGGQHIECGARFTQEQIGELVSALCVYSRYAYEAQIAQGYIPLPGGHRAGVCGRAAYESGEIARMSEITSVCIRIARRVDGASKPFRQQLMLSGRPARVLLLGPPGSGKTTALRDAALYLAAQGLHVAAADEREELFPAYEGEPIDVLHGACKADGLQLLMRAMSPQVLVTDEIGHAEDAQAVLEAARCGVGLLASAHGASISDVCSRPVMRTLFEQQAFDRYVLVGGPGRCLGIWDARGSAVMEGMHGKLGCGGNGDDRFERDGFSAGGRRKASPVLGTGDAAVSAAPERCDPL